MQWCACFNVQLFSSHKSLGNMPLLVSFEEYQTFVNQLMFRAILKYLSLSMLQLPSSAYIIEGILGFNLWSTQYKTVTPSEACKVSRIQLQENHRQNSLSDTFVTIQSDLSSLNIFQISSLNEPIVSVFLSFNSALLLQYPGKIL